MKIRLILAALAAVSIGTSSPAEDCRQVHSKLKFCGGEKVWTNLKSRGPDGVAMFRNSARSFGKVIVEVIKPGQVTREQIENAILYDLAKKQGGPDQSFSVDRMDGGEIDGQPAGALEYTIPGRTDPLSLLHSFVVRGDLLIQFITITTPGIKRGAARDLHRDFLGGFRITEAASLL